MANIDLVGGTNDHLKGIGIHIYQNRGEISLVWSQSNVSSSIKGGVLKELRRQLHFSKHFRMESVAKFIA